MKSETRPQPPPRPPPSPAKLRARNARGSGEEALLEAALIAIESLRRLLHSRRAEGASTHAAAAPACVDPVAEFFSLWVAGKLPVGFRSCSASQLHRAYLAWCASNAKRRCDQQNHFTRFTKLCATRSPATSELGYRVVRLRDTAKGGQVSCRCWVTADDWMPLGEAEPITKLADRVGKSVALFELELVGFRASATQPRESRKART